MPRRRSEPAGRSRGGVHEAPRAAAEWIESPTIGPVVFRGFEGFQGVVRVTWDGGDRGEAMTDAQHRAACVLVQESAELRNELLATFFTEELELDSLSRASKRRRLMAQIALRELRISADVHEGLAYADLACEDATGLRSASLHGVCVVGLYPFGDVRRWPEEPAPLLLSEWVEGPRAGPVILPVLDAFQGHCRLVWERASTDGGMTRAQARAARMLLTNASEIHDELCDALFRDQRDCAEDEDYPRARSPEDIPGLVELRQITLSAREKGGLAYTDFAFSDAWRVEHGLAATMHGTRLVDAGGYGDTRDAARRDGGKPTEEDAEPARAADGARLAVRWLSDPHGAVVALPMWEGFRGRWAIRFVEEDEGVPALTDAQREAARLLVEDGAAVRDALLARLHASHAKKTGRPPPDADALRDVVTARSIRVHAEDWDGIAYTELSLEAPWRAANSATVVMHGTRVVALTRRARVAEVIEADQEARLRASRAAKTSAKRRPVKKSVRRPALRRRDGRLRGS